MIYFVAYATVEGHTRKIAERIARQIEDGGDQARIMNVTEMLEYTLEQPDGVILCAPVHANRYPAPFSAFVKRESLWLNAVPGIFVSVSLSIASDSEAERAEVRSVAEGFLADTGWSPVGIHHAAGALQYTEYDFFKRWMARRLASRRGAPVDATHDFELTDWDSLAAFIGDFVLGNRQAGL